LQNLRVATASEASGNIRVKLPNLL